MAAMDITTRLPGYTLRHKCTFIDVESDEEYPARRRRSISNPPPMTHSSASFFATEDMYMSQLSGSLSHIWGTSGGRSPGGTSRDTSLDGLSLPELAGSSSAVTEEKDQAMGMGASSVVSGTLEHTRSASNSSFGVGLPMSPEKPSPAAEGLNFGSVGHPQLCARPCLFFARGECANGTQCSFCHMGHSAKPLRPDQKNRILLRQIPFSECILVALPVMREKIEDVGLDHGVLGMLDKLAATLAALGPVEAQAGSSPMLKARRRQQLKDSLRTISLRSIVARLRRAAPMERQQEVIDEFMQRLRSSPASQ